ncbi:lipoprotein [Oscillibacter sp. GMB15532]|uniref:LptM family lipoprotein n=1 Tax=Oscillibacter sp. GMB15532 TaxID=3230022 RepID=UPI0034DF1AE1
MKKVRIAILLLTLCVVLAACGQAAPPAAVGGGSSSSAGTLKGETLSTGTVTVCRIVDGAETGELLLAELNGAENGVYLLTVGNLPVTVDGQSSDAKDLTDGMTVEVEHSGAVLESYPAQFAQVMSLRAQTPENGSYTDLCGLWLKVLDDLWSTDPGLNGMEGGGTVPYVGVDLSAAPGDLTETEKAAVVWQFGRLHGAQALTGTFDELAEQGYIDREKLFWKDGVLFSITADEQGETADASLPTLTFDAQKWRGGDGAYFFSDCVCVWPERGTWTEYSIGSEAIS